MSIKQIYTKVLKSCIGFSVYGTKKVEEETKELLPLLNEFYDRFLMYLKLIKQIMKNFSCYLLT